MKDMNGYRKSLGVPLLCLVFIVLHSTKIPAQTEGPKRQGKFSETSLAALEERTNRIKHELAHSKDNWAGEYEYGDGLGVNVNLLIGPKSGFVFTWHGCLGLYDLNYGKVEWSGRNIKLLFEHPNDRKGFQGIAPELVPVLWGKRHYLIPQDEFPEFANAVNAGFEPCTTFCSRFLLKTGDEKKKVKGQPNIPDEYRAYLLKRPITLSILSVAESVVEKDKDVPELQYRITKVILNAGSKQGVLPGMEFHVFSPSGIYESAKVTKIEEQFSEAEIVQIGLESALPSAEWKLSTSLSDTRPRRLPKQLLSPSR